MSKSVKDCLLCLRLPVEKILEATNTIWSLDPEVAHKVGIRAAELLQEAYLKQPGQVCGKSPKALMAAAIYVSQELLELGQWKTQELIGKNLGVCLPSIRMRAKDLRTCTGNERIRKEHFKDKVRDQAKKMTRPRRRRFPSWTFMVGW